MGKEHCPRPKLRTVLAGGATRSISSRFSQQPPWKGRAEHPRVIREEPWGTGQVSDRAVSVEGEGL